MPANNFATPWRNYRGLLGRTLKSPYLLCEFQGIHSQCSGHYYLRVKLRKLVDGRMRIMRYCNMEAPRLQDPGRIDITFRELLPNLTISKRKLIVTDRVITGRTAIFDFETIVAYKSFPIDMMHETMNLVPDFMKIWNWKTYTWHRLADNRTISFRRRLGSK